LKIRSINLIGDVLKMDKKGENQSVKSLNPLEAFKLIKENVKDPNFIILDVRTPWEFSDEHIDGAENLDFTDPDFGEIVQKLDKDKKYLIYCKSGLREEKVFEIMKELGFSRVYKIKGGFEGWKSANLVK
jgi:rhodanese-related sulfurtransferase